MLIQGKKIAIVGGGPGGLTLARLLQLKHADVNVFERDADRSVRQQGATLDLHAESGLKALRVAGLLNEFKKHYRPGADKMRVVDQYARIQFEDHDTKTDNFDSLWFRPEIDRGPLRDMLIDSLLPGTVAWDSQFLSMTPEGAGWNIQFKNGRSFYADIVVAADGANSKIRPLITPTEAVYSKLTVVEGNIYDAARNAPRLHELTKGGKVFALGGERSIILSAKGDGCLSFYTGCKDDETWVKYSGIDFNSIDQVAAWFKERFGDWDEIWQELFATDQMYVVPRQMYHYPFDQTWEALPNLTMLGDAAHRMPPYAGEGVNMAMQDALELYESLTDPRFDSIQSAIGHYEATMRARASEVTAISVMQTEALHATDGLAYLVTMFAQ